MNITLLTKHQLECLSLKRGCPGTCDVCSCQSATLLEITCRGSFKDVQNSNKFLNKHMQDILEGIANSANLILAYRQI